MRLLLSLSSLVLAAQITAAEPCRIQIVDAENGWPVPRVELRTVHDVSFFTDNDGNVAFDLPELVGTETWLHVEADGYEAEADGFGMRGFRFVPEAGGSHTFEIHRTMLAKRLGRLTGAGVFAESQKLGLHTEWQESGVLGSDSVQCFVHRGKRHWGWGDTNLARYPLGIFHMPGATTTIRPIETFEPPLKLAFDYFRDAEGRVRNTANLFPDEPGPTWVFGYVSIPDATGEDRLVGCWSKIEPPLDTYRAGLCVWNDETANFETVKVLWDKEDGDKKPELLPAGHTAIWTDGDGEEWLLFGNPFPTVRMKPTFESWSDSESWEEIDPPKHLKNAEGEKVEPHTGSIAWNEFRQRWVAVFVELHGEPSPLGEVWYCESPSPLGPWGPAVKVLTHRAHTFYNPRIHADLVPGGSPILLFEGTYTTMFSKAKAKTPRHEYNQVLYRLDLDDPGLSAATSAP